jgi:hydroxyacylglutathione hydrolase
MLFKQFEDKGLSQYSYMVGCEKEGIAAVIDPRRDVDIYVNYATEHKLKIRYILETHIHADFASGTTALAEESGAEVLVSSYDTAEKYVYSFKHTDLVDGQKINLGCATLEAMHTPGHTPEHISFLVYDNEKSVTEPVSILSGDFLFMGSLGRPDLLGEEEKMKLAKRLFQSVNNKLPNLKDELLVYPGHGAGSLCGANLSKGNNSTMGTEREVNIYIKEKLSEEEFIKKIFSNTPPFPEYYLRMKEYNAKGQEVFKELPKPKGMDAKDFENIAVEEGVIIDTRHPLAFGGAHIPDSINLAMGAANSFWAASVIPYDVPVYLVLENESDLEETVRSLMRVGMDDIKGYLKPGFAGWVSYGADFRDIPQASALFLDDMMDAGEDLMVIDVRPKTEWLTGHIKGARNIYLGELQDKMDKLGKNDQTIFCICGGGHRSSIAASILQAAGFEMVYNVYGGMSSWKAAGLNMAGLDND